LDKPSYYTDNQSHHITWAFDMQVSVSEYFVICIRRNFEI